MKAAVIPQSCTHDASGLDCEYFFQEYRKIMGLVFRNRVRLETLTPGIL